MGTRLFGNMLHICIIEKRCLAYQDMQFYTNLFLSYFEYIDTNKCEIFFRLIWTYLLLLHILLVC